MMTKELNISTDDLMRSTYDVQAIFEGNPICIRVTTNTEWFEGRVNSYLKSLGYTKVSSASYTLWEWLWNPVHQGYGWTPTR